jgi:hypothetical protein
MWWGSISNGGSVAETEHAQAKFVQAGGCPMVVPNGAIMAACSKLILVRTTHNRLRRPASGEVRCVDPIRPFGPVPLFRDMLKRSRYAVTPQDCLTELPRSRK